MSDIIKCHTKFMDSSLSNEILKELNNYRKSEDHQFCDWTLITSDSVEFPVHKAVIVSACPYFKGVFNTKFTESRSDSMVLTKISGNSLSRILDYIYTGEIEIETDNMLETFEDASYLLLKNLQNFTADHVEKNINDDTCLNIWRFAETNLCEKLTNKCIKYISMNADRLLNVSFIEKLNINEILAVLKQSLLNCSEDDICKMIISWIENDFENRKHYVKQLFDEIRLPLLSDDFMISHVFDSKLLENCEIFSSKIHKTCKMKLQLNNNKFVLNKSVTPRYGARDKNILLIKNWSCQTYSSRNGLCDKASLPHPYPYSSSAAHTAFGENFLFVCGQNGNECLYYCPIQNKWRAFLPMKQSRKSPGAVFLRDKIYVCGGADKKSTEYFDLETEKWYEGVELSINRSRFGICAKDDCIYIVGEHNQPIERLDLREGKWCQIALSAATNYTKACIYNNSLFCMNTAGGSIFDLHQNKWNSNIPAHLYSSRNCFSFDICSTGSQIYLYECFQHNCYSDCMYSVCTYNDQGQWNIVHEYNSRNSSVCCVAIALMYT